MSGCQQTFLRIARVLPQSGAPDSFGAAQHTKRLMATQKSKPLAILKMIDNYNKVQWISRSYHRKYL